MIAYNKNWLDNLNNKEEIESAYFSTSISADEKEKLNSLYPVGFYSPNLFVRIGLFILTAIIAIFTMGIFALISLDGLDRHYYWLVIFTGLLAYAVLEYFVKEKKQYRSGVDDALMWISALCIFFGINGAFEFNLPHVQNAILFFVLAAYFFLRFADTLMACVVVLAFFVSVFLFYFPLNNFTQSSIPFVLMLLAGLIYFFANKLSFNNNFRHYKHGLKIMEIVSLICLYAASNYFVVQQLSNIFLQSFAETNTSVSYGWLFWFFTVTIPLYYIFRGIQKKDVIFLRVGLILIAAIVFTVRFYYSVMPMEVAMLIGGIIFIAISYALTKYLSQPKYGFTAAEIKSNNKEGKINIESLVIAETFSQTTSPTEPTTTFGGGSGGGGGASGEF
jgi:uncharacterized membrane protein YgcG